MLSRRRSARRELPSEIWHYISRFLSDDQLRCMYSVNRTFYRIAMGLRYREMSIGHFHGPDGLDTFKCYLLSNPFFYHIPLDSGNPELIQHVRSLKLKPTPIGDLLANATYAVPAYIPTASMKKGTPVDRLLVRAANITFRRPTRQQREEKARSQKVQMAQKLQDFVGALRQLKKLAIEWDPTWGGPPEYFDDPAQLLVKIGWQAYSSNLCALELKIPIEICDQILSPSLQLDRLENLTFWLEKYYVNTDDSTGIEESLVPFVRRHASTLKSLIFNSYQNLDMTTFFEGIGYIPHLGRLHLQQPYCGAEYSHSNAFRLHRYVKTLTEFGWSFLEAPDSRFNYTPPDVWFSQPPYQVVLPNLQQLKLGLWGFPLHGYFDHIVSYIGNHHSILTKLSLVGWTLSMTQFFHLARSISSSLTELEVSLEILSSVAISHIATNFPQLQVLHLSYNEVGREAWAPEFDAYVLINPTETATGSADGIGEARMRQFEEDIAAFKLPDWPLGTLFLLGGTKNYKGKSTVTRVGELMLGSLPRVGFVNGKYREEFLKPRS